MLTGSEAGLFRASQGQAQCLARVDFNLGDEAGLLQAMAQLLEQVRRGTCLRLLLASHYVRYALVPWSDDIHSPAELAAYVRLRYELIYGEHVRNWRFSLSSESAGKPRLSAALPDELLNAWRELVNQRGHQLGSVQPYLAVAFNRFRNRLEPDDFLFILAEPGRGSLLQVSNGAWVGVYSQGCAERREALADLVVRQSTLLGLAAGSKRQAFLHAPGQTLDDLALPEELHCQRLQLGSPADSVDPLTDMARVGC